MAVLSSEVWGCLVPSKERKKNFIVDFVGRQHRTLNSASQTSIKMPVKPKVVLAYSGGLDTSVVLKWLSEKVRVYEFVWCFVFFLGERGNVGEWLSLPSRRPAPPPPPTPTPSFNPLLTPSKLSCSTFSTPSFMNSFVFSTRRWVRRAICWKVLD